MNEFYSVIINYTTKEFWVAEPKYYKEINDIIERLKNSKNHNFDFYHTIWSSLEEDIAIEINRGNKQIHNYYDWLMNGLDD